MKPLRGICGATWEETSSSMLLDSLRRATGYTQLPMIVGICRFQRYSVGSEHECLPKKADITNYFHPTCLVNAAEMSAALLLVYRCAATYFQDKVYAPTVAYLSTSTSELARIYLIRYKHWPTKKYFFQNALEIYTCSEAEWCPKRCCLQFFFKINKFPRDYMLKLPKMQINAVTLFFNCPKKITVFSKRFQNFNIFLSGIVSLTRCCLQLFPNHTVIL